jgi:hypothetical protein
MLTYTFSSAEDANRKLGEIKRLMKNENMKVELQFCLLKIKLLLKNYLLIYFILRLKV